MMTTLNNEITNALKGKSIVIYEYDGLFKGSNISEKRRISHYFINDANKESFQPKYWSDVQIKKHTGIIVSVSGYYTGYEGTSISMVVTVNGEGRHVSINMEDTIELV
jgi:hypothetical protein